MNQWIVLALVVIALFAGVYLGRDVFPQPPVISHDTLTYHDTLTLPPIHDTLPAKIKYVLVKGEGGSKPTIDTIAHVDTLVGQYKDSLAVQYFYPPKNYFLLDFRPTPRPVEVKYVPSVTTQVIHEGASWWEKGLWFTAGVGTASIYHSLKK